MVSTRVGGIPEILPDSMITLCEPSVSDLIEKVKFAIRRVKSRDPKDPVDMHEKIKNMYNWRDVARRTEIVYNRVVEYKSTNDLIKILLRFRRCGYCGFYFITFVILVNYLLLQLFEFLNPSEKIDLAPNASDYGRKKMN